MDIKYSAAALVDDAWTYQWFFTPENGVEGKIQGETGADYTIPSVDCTKKGRYRAEVNCDSGSSATATVRVNAFGLSSTTLEIVPTEQGNWSYIWYSSATYDDPDYPPINPNPGTPYYTLPVGEARAPGKYYKVEATRTGGATALAIVQYYSDPSLGSSARVMQTVSANVKVTLAAGAVGPGGSYEWLFAPLDGSATDTGYTTPTYTINPADCTKRGTYSVKIRDNCNRTANPDPSATLQVYGCQ